MQAFKRIALPTLTFAMLGVIPNLVNAITPEILISIQHGRFHPAEVEIPADTKVKLLIDNQDDTPEEFDSYDLNREVLIHPNSKTSFYIGPLSAGRYKFEGEFSPETAQGVVIVK